MRNKWTFAGGRIKQRREFLGMTQKDLSKKTGLSQVTLSSLENERKEAKASTLCSLAHALQCDPLMFFLPPEE